MQDKKYFEGTWVATITPISHRDTLMKNTLSAHYKFLNQNNVTGIIPLSPLGEFASLSYQEKVDILRTLGQESGPTKIMPAICETSLKSALLLSRVAESSGADGLVLMAPFYYRCISEPKLVEYFHQLITTTNLPCFILNCEDLFEFRLSPHIIDTLQNLPNFYGIIDESEDATYVEMIHHQFPEILLLSGRDRSHFEKVSAGAKGIVSWIANAYPVLFTSLYQLTSSRQNEKAEILQEKIRCLREILRKYPHPDAIKYALFQCGFPSMTTRIPLDQLSEDQKSKLKTDLKKYIGTNLTEMLDQQACED